MKTVKWIILSMPIVLIGAVLFRGWIFSALITYQSIGQRNAYSVTDERLVALIDSNTPPGTGRGIHETIELALSITADHLAFRAEKSDVDPNLLVVSKSTHCVGYANFLSTTINYILDRYNLSEEWFAMPHIGQLFLLGENVHRHFDSSFFRSHDFVVIRNKKTGQTIAVDPVVYDYFGIDSVSFKEKHVKS